MNTRILKSTDIVSVIICAYNAGSTIRDTLQSLENQTFDKARYEVIVVDDGSTDTTGAIVQEFIERDTFRLHYFYQQNTGVGRARNAGIDQSIGKVLAFTDADCICDPDWIAVVYRSIHDEWYALIGGYTYSNDTVIFPWKMAPVLQTGITANLACDFMKIEGKVFDSGFKGMLGDDTDFVIRMAEKGMPMHYVHDMKVLHPPNLLKMERVIIRARGRHNEVALYKRHGEKVLSSFSPIFRPVIFGRISWFTVVSLVGLGIATAVCMQYGILGLLALAASFSVAFMLLLYRFFVIFNPDNRGVSLAERAKTLMYFTAILPMFFYYRVIGMIKFKYFML